MRALLLLLAAVLIIFAGLAHAQDPPGQSGARLVEAKVKGNREDDRAFGVNSTLQLKLEGVLPRTDEAFTVYVDDVPFTAAELPTAEDEWFEFRVDRPAMDAPRKAAWERLLGSPDPFNPQVPVQIKVGYQGKPPFDLANSGKPEATKLVLQTLWMPGFWIFVGGMTVLIWGVVALSRRSSLLRDRPAEGNSSVLGPFSLARCQMAVWFVVILGAFCFIWLVTGSVDSFSKTALGLLAISGATGLISSIIDRSKQAAVSQEREAAEIRKAEVQQAMISQGGGEIVSTRELNHLDTTILDASKALAPNRSKGWLTDILTDETGVAVHRLQNFVWTIVIAIIFAVSVYQQLAMPELSSALLGLMGLSSATYLGLKGPEKL